MTKQLTVDGLLKQLQFETHYADTDPKILNTQRKIILAQLLQLLEDVAPKKKKHENICDSYETNFTCNCGADPHNQATQDYLAKIKELFQ